MFVQNRLLEIRSSNDIVWKLIESGQNPADDISRGLCLSQLIKNEKWLYGPKFLTRNEKEWPNLKPGDKFSDEEEKVHLPFILGKMLNFLNLVMMIRSRV